MSKFSRETVASVAPYLLWMALMVLLPRTGASYAVFTAIVALVMIVLWWPMLKGRSAFQLAPCAVAAGLLVGVLVLVLWVWPDQFTWYRKFFVAGEGGVTHADECGRVLRIVRLLGSAFVIAPAEELFFRSFLYRRLQSRDWTQVPYARFDLSAFLWTVGLFAVEHNRWLAGAMAGALYAFVYMRRGLFVAILAHVTTNLLLGAYVLMFDAWTFW